MDHLRLASSAAFALLLMAVLPIAALLASSSAQAETKRAERVTVIGCPQAGATASCLMIRAVDGTLYNISAATPRPRRSARMIRVRGVVTDKANVCGQGIVLDRIRITRTRQRCPN